MGSRAGDFRADLSPGAAAPWSSGARSGDRAQPEPTGWLTHQNLQAMLLTARWDRGGACSDRHSVTQSPV